MLNKKRYSFYLKMDDDEDYQRSYQEYLKLRENLGKRTTNQQIEFLTNQNEDEYVKTIPLYNRENDDEIHQFILEKKGEYIQDYQRMINIEDVHEKDKIICFHRDTILHLRGTFIEFEDRENVGIVLNYKGEYRGREALLLKDYVIYYKSYQPYVYKSKFRKELESLLNLTSLRVRKKKITVKEEDKKNSEDLFEKIDEVESNDLFEKIDDEE